jgi:hypothetical protein
VVVLSVIFTDFTECVFGSGFILIFSFMDTHVGTELGYGVRWIMDSCSELDKYIHCLGLGRSQEPTLLRLACLYILNQVRLGLSST